ncbi:T9SS type A sorting domain-containing protein [Epilithonimonas hungarica]|uniref:Por secretion system C-terminal sorting domain-containing protein n=1 Tax=Epilithonimonas hungarica TaxID=454006 RepID=A0A1G7H026_9FLAO|nr:T9SS type A sorting domain-containing protein [Epilithonimonas hungarica]SDE93772.1 Por secretion system C-terminal sorting domain-containing protein [Epilithonimonas hungarica]
MKKIVFFLSALGSVFSYSQNLGYGNSVSQSLSGTVQLWPKVAEKAETCNTVVINDTEEQNGVFIIGNSGQKAAVDIPIAANQTIKINSIVVTLASKLPPTFVNFIFYDNILSTPEDPEDPRRNIPNQQILQITDTTIESYEDVGYEPLHEFVVRKVKVKLANPILLNGTMADGRIWMSTKSDANAWATTAHYDTGEGVVGESLAMGGNSFGWFQLLNQECLYELEAECDVLGVSDLSFNSKTNIYPNPAQDFFEYKNINGNIISTSIYSTNGSLVKTINSNESKINVSNLKNGVYIIQTKTSNGNTFTNKLIKK